MDWDSSEPPWTMAELAVRLRDGGEDALVDALGPFVLVSFGGRDGTAGGWTFSTKSVQSPMAPGAVAPDLGGSLVYPLRKRGSTFAGTILLGRASSNDVCMASSTVSKLHARIQLTADGFKLEDAGSSNGTFLEGERVREPVTVYPGDTLHFGTQGVRVQATRRFFDTLRRL
jgi:FHA domain-containing protein